RHACEHLAEVFSPERPEEVRVERIGVWERVHVDQRPIQGEVLDVARCYLDDASAALAELVSEDVHQDRLQPMRTGCLVLQASEGPIALQQGLLHEILRTISFQSASERVEARKLVSNEGLVGLLRAILGSDLHLRSTRHAYAFRRLGRPLERT